MMYTIMSRVCRDDGRDNWAAWDEDPHPMQSQEGSPTALV